MSSYKNFSIKDRQFRDSDTFKRPDLFETNKVNEQILKGFQNIKKNGVNYVNYFRYYPDRFLDYISGDNLE